MIIDQSNIFYFLFELKGNQSVAWSFVTFCILIEILCHILNAKLEHIIYFLWNQWTKLVFGKTTWCCCSSWYMAHKKNVITNEHILIVVLIEDK